MSVSGCLTCTECSFIFQCSLIVVKFCLFSCSLAQPSICRVWLLSYRLIFCVWNLLTVFWTLICPRVFCVEPWSLYLLECFQLFPWASPFTRWSQRGAVTFTWKRKFSQSCESLISPWTPPYWSQTWGHLSEWLKKGGVAVIETWLKCCGEEIVKRAVNKWMKKCCKEWDKIPPWWCERPIKSYRKQLPKLLRLKVVLNTIDS